VGVQVEEARKAKEEERTKWWRLTYFHFGDMDGLDRLEGKEKKGEGEGKGKEREEEEEGGGDGEEEKRGKGVVGSKVVVKGSALTSGEGRRVARDWLGEKYAKWERWLEHPDDPATEEERAELARMQEKAQDEAFEKANPDFCGQFRRDLAERQKHDEDKRRSAQLHRERGNAAYRAGDAARAVDEYMASLQLFAWDVGVLQNVAAARLKQAQPEDALEFAERAVYVTRRAAGSPGPKALFRRASALRALGRWRQAADDLAEASRLAPGDADLAREAQLARDEARFKERLAALQPALDLIAHVGGRRGEDKGSDSRSDSRSDALPESVPEAVRAVCRELNNPSSLPQTLARALRGSGADDVIAVLHEAGLVRVWAADGARAETPSPAALCAWECVSLALEAAPALRSSVASDVAALVVGGAVADRSGASGDGSAVAISAARLGAAGAACGGSDEAVEGEELSVAPGTADALKSIAKEGSSVARAVVAALETAAAGIVRERDARASLRLAWACARLVHALLRPGHAEKHFAPVDALADVPLALAHCAQAVGARSLLQVDLLEHETLGLLITALVDASFLPTLRARFAHSASSTTSSTPTSPTPPPPSSSPAASSAAQLLLELTRLPGAPGAVVWEERQASILAVLGNACADVRAGVLDQLVAQGAPRSLLNALQGRPMASSAMRAIARAIRASSLPASSPSPAEEGEGDEGGRVVLRLGAGPGVALPIRADIASRMARLLARLVASPSAAQQLAEGDGPRVLVRLLFAAATPLRPGPPAASYTPGATTAELSRQHVAQTVQSKFPRAALAAVAPVSAAHRQDMEATADSLVKCCAVLARADHASSAVRDALRAEALVDALGLYLAGATASMDAVRRRCIGVGNAAALVTSLLEQAPADDALRERLTALATVDTLIQAIKDAGDSDQAGALRKNAAVAVAKLATFPAARARLSAIEGTKVLLQLQSKLL
jgi:tetratricopeptide (TPR) repeat protein